MYTYIETLEKYQNPSSKWMVRVKVSESESMFLQFTTEPTDQQIIDTTNQRLAILKSSGTKVNIITQQESIEFPSVITIDDEVISNPSIQLLITAGWRYAIPFVIPEGQYAINKVWKQNDVNPNMAECEYDLVDSLDMSEAEELAFQNDKSYALKLIENTYIDFLTTEWSPALQSAGLVPADYIVTIDNTDEQTNVGLLLQMRGLNREDYAYCSNEFLKFKSMILELGGIMAKVKLHEVI